MFFGERRRWGFDAERGGGRWVSVPRLAAFLVAGLGGGDLALVDSAEILRRELAGRVKESLSRNSGGASTTKICLHLVCNLF